MSGPRKQSRPSQGLPDALPQRLADILGPDGLRAWREAASSAAAGARINTLRGTVAAAHQALAAEGFTVTPVPWLAEALTVPQAERPALTRSRLVAEGLVYPQNLSSMLPPLCLAPEPGMEVLDLAAAPGSKTLQMAAQMDNRGRLAAVERSRSRFHKLQANCRRAGADCVRLYLKDGTRVGRLTPERFDRVLVDAPCSAEARIDPADPSTAADWHEKKIRRLAGLQRRLLESGLQALKPGGLLVYATCTFAPEENEAVVDAVRAAYPDSVTLQPLRLPVDNARAGLTHWRGRDFHPALTLTARILPAAAMEGFYIAMLRKSRSIRPVG